MSQAASAFAAPLTAARLAELRDDHPETRIIDVRTPAEFATRHIPGSYNVPLDQLGEHRDELAAKLAGTTVLVCESGKRAATAEERLRTAGLDEVHVLDGGVAAWEATGGELNRGDVTWSLERQVRFTAGSIVLTAILTSLVWKPAKYLAGAIGLGLVVASVTDTCLMGMLLAKLPHNRKGAATCDMTAVVAELTGQSR